MQVSPNASQDEILDLIRQDEKLVSYLTGEIKKCILVPGKIMTLEHEWTLESDFCFVSCKGTISCIF